MGDLQDMRARAAAAGSLGDRFARAQERYIATKQQGTDRRAKKRQEEEEAKRRAELEQAKLAAELKQEKMRQQGAIYQTAQRALFASDAADQDFRNTSKLQQQQQGGVLKRDKALAGYDSEQKRKDALAQRARDERQFGYTLAENDQKFGQQLQRDYYQQGYDLQRAQQQHGNTLERDQMQFGFDTKREQQQSRNTMQRDILQGGIQAQRDQRLNEFDLEQQDSQFRNQMQRDQQLQQYETQSLYQREAADISAKWQDQVAQARNAGLDFSDRQKKEMADLDAAFRKNVLNGPYDEGLKQQAMVEHQRKLSAIIPEEKVQNPQDMFSSSIVRDPETGQKYIIHRDSRGFPVYEPMENPQASNGVDRQAEAAREALFDREERFQKLVDKLATAEKPGGLGEPLYGSHEEVLKEAMKQFAPMEDHYRKQYGLPPQAAYQAEADTMRAEQEKKAAEIQREQELRAMRAQKASAGRGNPYREFANKSLPSQSGSPSRGALMNRRGDPGQSQQTPQQQPVILSTKPVPDQIVNQLKTVPGGPELHKLREKHSSKALNDQAIRYAADIVMNSMLSGDTSDPDYAEAVQILERAGYKVGK